MECARTQPRPLPTLPWRNCRPSTWCGLSLAATCAQTATPSPSRSAPSAVTTASWTFLARSASAGLADIAGQAIVPLAQMVDNGACIEDALLPQPANFGAKRRLARRFDEGLLLEVEVLAK